MLNESSAESSCMSFLHYFHAGISNHLSEKPKIWSLNTGLTVYCLSYERTTVFETSEAQVFLSTFAFIHSIALMKKKINKKAQNFVVTKSVLFFDLPRMINLGQFALFEPGHETTGFLHMRKQDADQLRSNREADQRLCFRYIDSTFPLLSKSEISSL